MAERILIVEDDPATREGLALLLQTLGYRVTAAPDGATALAALRQEPPDVMLLDLILPGDMSGIQLLQTAREESPQVGAIVMTGFPSAETTVEALRLGAFDYLTKPFDLGRMSSLLTQLVTRQRQERRSADTLRQLETISRCSRIGIYSVDLAGLFTYWGGSGLLGYSAEEMVGRKTPAAFVRTPRFDLASELDACRRAGSVLGEHEVERKDGQRLTIRTKLLPLFDVAHRSIGYAGYLMDISEERRLQETQQGRLLEMEGRLRGEAGLVEAYRDLHAALREGVGVSELVTRGLTGILGAAPGGRGAWCFLRENLGEELRSIPVEGGGTVWLAGAAHTAPDPHLSASALCGIGTCDCVQMLSGQRVLPLGPTWVRCGRLEAAGPGGVATQGHLTLPLTFRGAVLGILNVATEQGGE
jgi:PAS domain S-box-containing protein